MASNLKISEKYYLYAFVDKIKIINLGKKVSAKVDYISSATSLKFWSKLSSEGMDQYSIIESDNKEAISAAEWWALDYGMTVLGKDRFYNKVNNAHKGDQSLVTAEMKAQIVSFFEGRLQPIKDPTPINLGVNLINKAESGEYPIKKVPVFELDQYITHQVRAVKRNISKENDLVSSWNQNPSRVEKLVDPVIVCEMADGSFKLVNGHTRIGAASRCRGWNTLPAVFIKEEEFGDTPEEIETNLIQAGSYANREEEVTRAVNTEEDVLFQMNNMLAVNNIDIKLNSTRDYAKEFLTDKFWHTIPNKKKLAGLIKRLFNQFDKSQADVTVQQNMITYTDSELRDYKYKTYESKGVYAIVSTFTNMDHFEAFGFVWHHIVDYKDAKELAMILHFRTKHEWLKEQSEGKAKQLKEVIARFNLPVTVDVLPSFKEE
jgi:hypothetical protein